MPIPILCASARFYVITAANLYNFICCTKLMYTLCKDHLYFTFHSLCLRTICKQFRLAQIFSAAPKQSQSTLLLQQQR